MMNKDDDIIKDDTVKDTAIRTYAVITSVTCITLLISSLCTLNTIFDEDRIAKGTRFNNKVNKFTILCASLFGAETIGGLLWQKLENKKAGNKTNSFVERHEQEKLKAPEISTSRYS